jgi:hypothetical protein
MRVLLKELSLLYHVKRLEFRIEKGSGYRSSDCFG